MTPAGVTVPPSTAPSERRPDRAADVSPGQIRSRGHPDAFWFDGLEGGRLSRRARQPQPEPQERQHEAQQQGGGLRRDEPQHRQPDGAGEHADDRRLTASDDVGHPAADGCGDGAQAPRCRATRTRSSGHRRLELLDKERHEHQGGVEDHRRPEDPDHGRREGGLDANRCGSTAGCSVRSSTRTKGAGARPPRRPRVAPGPPPSSSRSPNRSEIRNAARRPRPGRSIGRGARASRPRRPGAGRGRPRRPRRGSRRARPR